MINKIKGAMPPIVIILLLMTACKKDKPEPTPPTVIVAPPPGKRVFVVNEGAFMSSNASVSLYDAEKNEVEQDRFANQNSGDQLGDVAQSMIRHGDEYFIVVNNSNKIVVCDLQLKKKGEIINLEQPRFIKPIGNNLAFVSQTSKTAIVVLDLATRAIIKKIPLNASANEMLWHQDRVFVTNSSGKYLYVLSVSQQTLIDSIEVGYGGAHIVMDRNSKLWVLAYGNWQGPEVPKLVKVNPDTKAIEADFEFPKTDMVNRLTMSNNSDTLYYLHNGVRRMPISATALPGAPFITTGFGAYGVRVNPYYNHIYVADAFAFNERSLVTVYNMKGDSLRSFRTGIGSGFFFFE